jgi:hypothetical protein
MVETVTVPEGAVAGQLAPGQTMPTDAPAPESLDITAVTPAIVPAPADTPAKFLNADGSLNSALAMASYVELEKRQSSSGEDDPNAEPKIAPVKDPDADPAPDADKLKVDEATYGKVVDDAITSAGMTPTAVAQEWADNGKLSDATLDSLDKAGFSRDVVNQYISGAQAQIDAAENAGPAAEQAAANAAREVTEIMAAVGGEEAYGEMSTWAKTGLKPAEAKAYNDALDTGNRETIDMAVRGLQSKFVEAVGKDPDLVIGGARPSLDAFQSPQEASDALHKAQKSGDPAQIRAAEQKALRSTVFEG